MAKRKRRRQTSNRRDRDDYPAWVWMLFGLSIGLAVAFAVYVNGRSLPQPPAAAATVAASPQNNIDANGESAGAAATTAAADEPESRFDFYNMLPNFEVVIVEQEPNVERDSGPQAIVDPGEYVLQAGSFSRHEDADRRRAQLALQGIESTIQRVAIDDKTYHRVRIGPTRDLDQLNLLRARLREANIDVLRIRLGD